MLRPLDEDTALRFLEGDAEAFARVREFVSRFVSHRKGYRIQKDESDDVIQEVLTSLLKDLRSNGVRSRKAFEARVRHHAHCRCIDLVRRQARDPLTTSTDEIPVQGTERPDRGALDRERMESFEKALAWVGPRCVELMRLRLVEDLSWRKIAEKMGENENRLRQRLHKCIRRARAFVTRARTGSAPGVERITDLT